MIRVEQQNTSILETLQQSIGPQEKENTILFQEKLVSRETELTEAQTVNMKDVTYMKPAAGEETEQSVAEEIESAAVVDAGERKDQMAVLANTTSAEDYAKMQEDGFVPGETTTNTIVTETDKIKAQLAKAGADISYFGDDLDMDQLAEITGSVELATQLAKAFREADIPLTEENVRDAAEALKLAGTLGAPADGTIRYLIGNGLTPSVACLYKAQVCGGSYPAGGGAPLDISSFSAQIERVIRQAGFGVNDQTMADSRWLLEHDIPLTEENLSYYEELKGSSLPPDPGELVKKIATAVAEGGRPQDAVLLDGYDRMSKAQHAMDIVNSAADGDLAYLVDNGMELNIRNLGYAIAARPEAGAAGTASAPVPAGAQTEAGAQAGMRQIAPGAQAAAAAEQISGAQAAAAAGQISGAREGGAVRETSGTAADAAPQQISGAQESGAVQQASGSSAGESAGDFSGDGSRRSYTQHGLALLTARRQLEEIRLAMTVEANYRLLKRGVLIDTEPIVKLVEKLRASEDSYYENLLRAQGVESDEENTAIFRETTEKVSEIRYVPACVLGLEEETGTINAIHRAGTALKENFDRANERYETLMTAPRVDLGDSIQKAFRNVDVILKDIGLEASEANRRAVRILGYNGLAITEESVAQMKQADEEVQRVFRNMTPAVVTQLIKRGINPLDMDFASLNAAAEQIRREADGADTQRFAEYLWKLEKSDAITEDERNTYIGIYRLIHQVEQTDGAAVGAVMNWGADITMRNLITAVRSERRSGKMDYAVDGSFEPAAGGYREGSITDQIGASYHTNCVKDIMDVLTPEKVRMVLSRVPDWENMTPEQLKEALGEAQTDEMGLDYAYAKEQLAELEESARASQDIYRVLEKYDIPNTAANVLAVEAMMKNRNQMYRKIFGTGPKAPGEEIGTEDLAAIREELIEEFGEAVKTPEEMGRAQEKLANVAENVMKTMIESDPVTSLDVREMRMLSSQLSVSSMLAKEEQYSIPVMVSDGVVNVTLKIVNGVDKKGTVDIMMESELRGKIAATFSLYRDKVNGLIATDREETRELLEQNGGPLADDLGKIGELTLHYAEIPDLDLNHFSMGMFGVDAGESAPQTQEEAPVQTALLYQVGERFIRMARGVL